MQKFNLVLLIISINFGLLAQKNNLLQVINEIDLTMNYSYSFNKNKEVYNQFGGGIGLYHSFFKEKPISLNTGLRYDLNRKTKYNIYDSHYSILKKAEYSLHNLSIPLNVRYKMGNNTKFFIQTGGYLSFLLSTQRKGIKQIYYANEIGDVIIKETKFKDKGYLSNFNIGLSGMLGSIIPVKEHEIIIGIEYMYGFINLIQNSPDLFFNRSFYLHFGFKF